MSCPQCSSDVPSSETRCPHCGTAIGFPNVAAARLENEQKALAERYSASLRRAEERGVGDVAGRFETAASKSDAVISRGIEEVLRLAKSDLEVYGTFDKWLASGLRLRDTDPLNRLRHIAEFLLFPGYGDDIRFAALSLDGRGPDNYGQFTLVLRESMIAHRASVFEENCLLWMLERDVRFKDMASLPLGFRATWEDRGKLAVTKVEARLCRDTSSEEFAGLLLMSGSTTRSDTFVETHIWGPFTIQAVSRVTARPGRRAHQVMLRDLERRLKVHDVELVVA